MVVKRKIIKSKDYSRFIQLERHKCIQATPKAQILVNSSNVKRRVEKKSGEMLSEVIFV